MYIHTYSVYSKYIYLPGSMECCIKETGLVESAVLKRLSLCRVLYYGGCPRVECCIKEAVLV